MTKAIEVLVIGGGQAGLAMSRSLRDRGIEHVVLERGAVGQRWRDVRWESLHLQTPRWQSRLPGWNYTGPDPDGYMSRDEVVRFLDEYAQASHAPVETDTNVTALRREGTGFHVATSRGAWFARQVVIATGYCDVPWVPPLAAALPRGLHQTVPAQYRSPAELPEGGVLVVGASASGVQLAAEIRRAGRAVTLSVGRHVRLPRVYRGADLFEWLDAAGVLADRAADVRDLDAARRLPSFPLSGAVGRESLDLAHLAALGVRLAGRVVAITGSVVHFSADLADLVAAADARGRRVLERIDQHIARHSLAAPAAVTPPAVPAAGAPTRLDLAAARIGTVLWATGYRRRYDWLEVPVLDAHGELAHAEGVTAVPGLYVLGMRFQSRRNSSFLDGVGADARQLARHIVQRARRPARAAA